MTDLLSAFRASVARHPDRVAIVEGSEARVTFAELQGKATALAARFRSQGVKPGDRVLVATSVGIGLYAGLSAVWQCGATAVFPEPSMGLKGLRHAIQATRPTALLASGPFKMLRFLLPGLWFVGRVLDPSKTGAASQHDRQPTVSADDLALISFTSGSTGAPKAIARSHAFLMAQLDAVSPLLRDDAPQRDLVAFPVFVLANLALGHTSVLPNWKMTRPDQADPARLRQWMTAQDVTRALLPPVICEALADGAPLPAQAVLTGGGPVFPDVVTRLRSATDGLRVVSVYGSTEAEPIAELDANDVSQADLGAMAEGRGLLAGPPVEATAVDIIDGEIVVTGPHVNQGYLDPARDTETKLTRDGRIWHRTGDAGRLDAHGRLWLLGRHGQAVDGPSGPIHPFAVETAARFWPGVTRSALVATNRNPILVIEGDDAQRPLWVERAASFGLSDIRHVGQIPMDRRHRSKVDVAGLRQNLGLTD